MGAKSRRAQKIRQSTEFDAARLRAALTPPPETSNVYAWTLPDIMAARDQQLRGQFSRPAALAVAMRTNYAIGVARRGRLAPQRCIQVELVAAKGAGADSIRNEADAQYGQNGVAVSAGTRADINGCLVDHGVAFAINDWIPREDGSRIDNAVRYWPIEHVRWDELRRSYVTRVDTTLPPGGTLVQDQALGLIGAYEQIITHGDGRWIVFAANDHKPHQQDAAIVDGCLVWATIAYGGRDWSQSSVAHGTAKVIGEMPAGTALQEKVVVNGVESSQLTADAVAFAQLLAGIATSPAMCGIRPAGSKVDFLTSGSSAWQIFKELVGGGESAAARIYLGTDGVLGSKGGAPGVDVQAMFGVATTKVQGDLGAISRGLKTGSVEIWCALNFGSSKLAPTHRYMIPDADADANYAAVAARETAFQAHIKELRDNGFVVDQAVVDAAAKAFGVDAPKLPAATAAKAPTIALAPTDLAIVVSVNEARASAGLGPLKTREGAQDPDGFISVGEYKAKKEAVATPPAATPALRAV